MKTSPNMTIGECVRVARQAKAMSQEDLGLAVGVSRVTICTIEGGRSDPGYMTAYLLARALGFDLGCRPNVSKTTCVCALYGPAECRVCYPHGYKKS